MSQDKRRSSFGERLLIVVMCPVLGALAGLVWVYAHDPHFLIRYVVELRFDMLFEAILLASPYAIVVGGLGAGLGAIASLVYLVIFVTMD